MRLTKYSAFLPILAGLLLFWWASMPPRDIVLNNSCEAAGLRNSLSATLYGKSFWQGQLDLIRSNRDELARLPAQLDRLGNQNQNTVSPIEKKLSMLSQGGNADAQQRELTEQVQQRRRLELLGWLNKCEAAMMEKLR